MQRTTVAKLLAALWLCCFTGLVYAATSMSQYVRDFDYLSLFFAAAAGAVGGFGRTVITLMQKERPVLDVRNELLKDITVALLGGAWVYGWIQGYNALARNEVFGVSLPVVPDDMRVILIVLAGASRGRWMGATDAFISDTMQNLRSKLRGGEPVEPTSVIQPLGDK